jgi:hypothetical protein
MENQILDDNSFGSNAKEETMRNNIDRANYTIYSMYVLGAFVVIIFLTNFYFVFNIDNQTIFTEDNPMVLAQVFLGLLSVMASITGFVFFLMWFRRAYKNIQIIGYETPYKDGWAVGGFFVPFINFFYPYEIMKTIWQKMRLTAEGNNIKHYLEGGIYGWWWFFWLFSSILGSIASKMSHLVEFTVYFSLFTNIVEMVDVIICILVISRLRDTEKELREHGGF